MASRQGHPASPESVDLDARRTADDHLMIRLQNGSRAAFDELVTKYQTELCGFFYKNLRDWPLAEDLTQETLLKIYNQSWDYLPLGRFRGWMFRIARNLMIDNSRRRSRDALVHSIRVVNNHRREEQDAVAQLASEWKLPEERAAQADLAAHVDRFLEELPPEQRMTFTLHHFHGVSLAEVADAMETNESTAKSRLRLAREKLRQRLESIGITGKS